MTIAPTIDIVQLAETAAAAVGRTLAVGEPLTLGPAITVQAEPELTRAVLAALGGTVAGEIAIFVDDALVQALQGSDLGALDLAAALAPSLDELARALGSVLVGVPQAIDARLAYNRIAGQPEAVSVTLVGATQTRAAVAVGLQPVGAGAAVEPGPAPAERLDLLRGVEMAATVELGRARMTINDLLSLRDGAVIELDRAAGDAADLFVNGRLIARGEVVVVDENYGLRVTQIVTDEAGL